jgi:hypothetical protein
MRQNGWRDGLRGSLTERIPGAHTERYCASLRVLAALSALLALRGLGAI